MREHLCTLYTFKKNINGYMKEMLGKFKDLEKH